MVSDLEKSDLMCLKNSFAKKCAFKFFRFMCFYFFAFFFKVTLWTNIAILTQIWDHNVKKVYLKLLFFLFCTQSSKLSWNMHKLHVKLRNTTFYPPWGLRAESLKDSTEESQYRKTCHSFEFCILKKMSEI